MSVTLTELTLPPATHSGNTRWNNHLNIITIKRDRLVNGCPIIGVIGHHHADFTLNLIEQWRHLRRIVCMLICEYLHYNHAGFGIGRQMQLALCLASNHCPAPKTCRPGTINQNMQRPLGHRGECHDCQSNRGVIRHWDRQLHQCQNRIYQAFGLSKWALEWSAQHQARLNGDISIACLTHGSAALPIVQRIFL